LLLCSQGILRRGLRSNKYRPFRLAFDFSTSFESLDHLIHHYSPYSPCGESLVGLATKVLHLIRPPSFFASFLPSSPLSDPGHPSTRSNASNRRRSGTARGFHDNLAPPRTAYGHCATAAPPNTSTFSTLTVDCRWTIRACSTPQDSFISAGRIAAETTIIYLQRPSDLT